MSVHCVWVWKWEVEAVSMERVRWILVHLSNVCVHWRVWLVINGVVVRVSSGCRGVGIDEGGEYK